MSKEDRDSAQAKAQREAASKAVLDNMARLKALRLAREAAEPPRVVAKKAPAKSANKGAKKEKEPTPTLSAWLASQQNGGQRT